MPGRAVDGAARLPIDRAFTMKGFGTVVTGTLVSGRIEVEQELAVLPPGRTVKIRGVQVHGATRPAVEAGRRAALNVGGADVTDVPRGQVLAEPGTLEPTRILDAAIELLGDARPLKHGARVRVHQGTAEVLARVGLAPTSEDGVLVPGAPGFVRLGWSGRRPHARRSIHPAGVLAAEDDCRRARARPACAAHGSATPSAVPRFQRLRGSPLRGRTIVRSHFRGGARTGRPPGTR